MTRFPFLLAIAAAPILAATAVGAQTVPETTAAPASPAKPAANPFLHDETKAEAEGRAQAMFARMDLNHDGFVTMAEMSAFAAAHAPKSRLKPGKVPATPPFVKAMFADADADHDGRISADESKAAADRGFDATDTDHDGIVTPAERLAAEQDVAGDKPKPRDDVGR